jgi:hypothetical protein
MSEKWTIEEDAILTRMAREGHSAVAIAEIVGRSRKAVAQRAARLGLSLHGTKWREVGEGEPTDAWPDADFEQAKAWWTSGVSSGEIAERLGRTRNSVIGKLRRAGIAKSGGYDDQHIERRLAAKRAAKAKRERERRERARIERIALAAQEGALQAKVAKRPSHYVKTQNPPKIERPAPVGEGFTIGTVGAGQCRWMDCERADAESWVCGKPVKVGSWCCHEHYRFAYQPPPKPRVT